jgi:hypothetical protein
LLLAQRAAPSDNLVRQIVKYATASELLHQLSVIQFVGPDDHRPEVRRPLARMLRYQNKLKLLLEGYEILLVEIKFVTRVHGNRAFNFNSIPTQDELVRPTVLGLALSARLAWQEDRS